MSRFDEYGVQAERASARTDPGCEAWLQAARQQSQALAELRAAHAIPFEWTLKQTAHRRFARPLWLTAALAAGVLGLAGVTLATLHSRRAVTPAPNSKPAHIEPLGTAPTVAARRAPPPRREVRPAVAPAPEQPASVRRSRAPGRRPAASAASQPAGQVIFEGDEPGAVIIVTPPPRRLAPIWTPEEYKKRRSGQQRW